MKHIYYFLFFVLFIGLTFNAKGQIQKSKQEVLDEILIDGEFIIRLQEGWNPYDVVKSLPQEFEVEVGRLLSKPSDIWLFNFNENNTSVHEVLKAIKRIRGVKTAQVNTKVDLRQAPNDPLYGNQWQHQNIDSESAWDITTGGKTAHDEDIVVCIIESADVMGHPDLQDNHWVNTGEIPNNGIDDDNNGYVDDYNGWNVGTNTDNIGTGDHGTAVAGMIGAKGDNGQGIAGANWDVKMMVVAGYANPFTQANIVEAYTYPMEHRILYNQTNGAEGSFVVSTNASWGVDGGDPADYPIWCDFYDDLGEVGILNCGATTNQNENVDTFGDVPTGCASPFMVSVTATNINDEIDFAGYGQNTINVAAPGSNIYTTASNGNYDYTSGTSFASPYTAGVIGLMYSIPCPNFMDLVKADPMGAAEIVREALYDGVDQNAHLMTRTTTGGRINAKNSIDLLMAQVCGDCTPPQNLAASSINDTEATIEFEQVTDAIEYTIYFQEAGTGTWSSITTSNLDHTFTDLDLCTDYECYVETVCDGETSFPTGTLSFRTTGCPNCITLDYCEASVNSPEDEWIDIFEIDDFINNSGNDNGYGDYTSTGDINLTRDNSYDITITPAWNGQQYDEYSRIWIDYNQDGIFDESELAFDQGSASQNIVNGTITIPETALTGSTRMRVQMAYIGPGQENLPDVCETFEWGEIEDYCVEIKSNQICNMDVSSTISEPTCTGVADGQIELSVSGGVPDYTYDWSNDETTSNISNLTQGSYSVIITDESSCDTTVTFNLTNSYDLTLNSTINQPSCAINSDGSIEAVASGGNGITYQWTDGPSSALYENLGEGSYEVTATDENGCIVSENYTLNYTSNISINSTITQPSCDNTLDGEITANATGGDNITYQWTGGPNSATWSEIGNGFYEVTATDENGCFFSETFELEANPTTPNADFMVTPNYLEVEVFNSSTNGLTFTWDFGDGNTSNEFNTTHTYAEDGTYDICLTVDGECDQISITCKEVTVSEDIANLTGNDIENFIIVFPNPANNLLNFKIQTERATSIDIIDATGKLVGSYSVEEKLTEVNVQKFVNGLYIYNVKDKNGNSIKTDKISIVK